MDLHVHEDPAAVAAAAAAHVATGIAAAVAAHGACRIALSGGRTPWAMLDVLVGSDVPWPGVHLYQVDERIAPDGDASRNWTRITEHLLAHVALPDANLHAMPVTHADGPEAAAVAYAATLASLGAPPVLDLVLLGLGDDGHTASLVPGDAALDERERTVVATGEYQGQRRLTLTYPVLDAARHRLWLVTGASKAPALAQLRAGDPAIPAGRVRAADSVAFVDRAALG